MISEINYANFDSSVRKLYVGENQQTLVTLGPGSYLVNGSFEYGSPKAHLLIGRYSSLGHRLVFEIGLNHNYKKVSSYPFGDLAVKDGTGTVNHEFAANHYQIIIGSDVWIGCDVMILGGVHIGNGAVIGAGSVVAGDIPPYAIAVGNPAKVIKYRFSQNIIERLQTIKWWYWDVVKIKNNLSLMETPQNFIDQFYNDNTDVFRERDIILQLQQMKKEGYMLYYLVADFEETLIPVWKNVLIKYLRQFTARDKIALIFEFYKHDSHAKEIQVVNDLIVANGYDTPLILSHYGEKIFSLEIMKNVDFFITSKEDIASICADYANDYKKNLIYGLDENIFGETL
ncbi:CatB-related O-acetyltransferase [Pectinatus haikarae]|uniref:Virginiamycin A acetyltransferase n=1 Tax=Pectinatus haikarae TaxID=349096 RepID=A0ABT9YBC1_9FIRM|nr:CatB-related O-acetyltransferase [Pectinatus haikarae]MDQ0205143.1 virginiamycin A acetyltransferase [Pectinatus haikarae]